MSNALSLQSTFNAVISTKFGTASAHWAPMPEFVSDYDAIVERVDKLRIESFVCNKYCNINLFAMFGKQAALPLAQSFLQFQFFFPFIQLVRTKT